MTDISPLVHMKYVGHDFYSVINGMMAASGSASYQRGAWALRKAMPFKRVMWDKLACQT